MKKFLAKLICLMLLVCVSTLGLVACSQSSWKGSVTLKNSGNVIENGGFIAETENYLYFINGMESSTANNKMGTPLKGALLVADKNDLSKTEVVVPKLMVASDYNSGFFIDGGYVYYATPSVEKNSEGNVANNELTFMKTKLDGSGETKEFFTYDGTSAISLPYRIVKAENGGIFIYYYDQGEKAIMCYSVASGNTATIIKTSEKADSVSLDKYLFLKSSDIDGVVGYYTTSVYKNEYSEEAASKPGYTRNPELYNRVYAIEAGKTQGTLLVDGDNDSTTKLDDTKYTIKIVNNGYLFFSTTNANDVQTYALSLEDAKDGTNWTDKTKLAKIVKSEYVESATLIISLSEVYVLGDTKVYKTTLLQKDDMIKQPVALKENVNKLLFVDDGYLYYVNAESQIAKTSLNPDQAEYGDKEILVSADTAEIGWYNVEVKEIGGKKYMFYCDNSTTGKTYVKCVDLGLEVVEKDTDNDGEINLYYLDDKQIFVFGKMTDKDTAAVFDSKVELQASYGPAYGIGENEQDDKMFYDVIMELKEEYNGLRAPIKELVSETATNTLKYIEKAFKMAEEYRKLEGIGDIGSAEEAEELGFKLIYDEMKKDMLAFKDYEHRDAVDIFISDNLKSNWTKAQMLFEGKK